jgi:hypothetical protein
MKINIKHKIKSAYTIVELSIAILVISILMSGVFSIATGSLVANKNSITSQKLNLIYNSIGTFVVINKRLPCPASLNKSIIDDAASYGEEAIVSGDCSGSGVYTNNTGNIVFGGVPIKALNLDSSYAVDEFGNKLNYIIDKRFAKNYIASLPVDISTSLSFGTTSATNIITVREVNESDTLIDITADAIMLIISSGANGFGAFGTNGIQNSNSNDARELNNQCNSSANPCFNNIFFLKSSTSNQFDDVMLYKTRLNFINDFSLSNLIACPGSAITDPDFTQKTLYNGQFLYANSVCTNFPSMIKILRCSFGGEWQYVVRDCPI